MFYYSPSTRGFYHEDVHGKIEVEIPIVGILVTLRESMIPADVVEVTPAEHMALMVGQNAGKLIVPGEGGKPVLIDHPAQTPEIAWMVARRRRDALLRGLDWTQLPDVPEALKEKYAAVRQRLRDLPTLEKDPTAIDWTKYQA